MTATQMRNHPDSARAADDDECECDGEFGRHAAGIHENGHRHDATASAKESHKDTDHHTRCENECCHACEDTRWRVFPTSRSGSHPSQDDSRNRDEPVHGGDASSLGT